MPNRIYEELIADEDLLSGLVVALVSDNRVEEVARADGDTIGVTDEAFNTGTSGRVVVFGRVTVECTGTVSAGDRLVGSSAGRVKKHTASTTSSAIPHGHNAPLGFVSVVSETDDNTDTLTITSGELSGGKIVGKALTGGTNEDIDFLLSVCG